MRRSVLLPALLALAGTVAAASPDRAALNVADFDFVVAKVTANYAGYDTKVTDASRPALMALTERLRQKASSASDAEMAQILQEWVGFFHDGHTRVYFSAATGTEAPAPRRPTWTEDYVRRHLAALGDRRDPVEGIWLVGGGRYRLGVLRSDARASAFSAVVLATMAGGWAPQDIKAELHHEAAGYALQYRAGDRSLQAVSGRLLSRGEALDLGEPYGVWLREWPAVEDVAALQREWPGDELALVRLSPSTWWLRIPDFDDGRAKPLRELLAQRAAELATVPNLVIDLRNNGGGSDYVYEPLLPLLYTRPIYSIDVELCSSPDNIALRQAVAERLRKENEAGAAVLEAQNRALAAHPGAYVQVEPRPFSAYVASETRPSPRRVAVLIDGAASSGEQFILDARQSRKVTLFGQRNSAGILDFANVVAMESPSGRVHVQWATSRSLRLPDDPVDPMGIAPDIRIDQSARDPVAYAQAWLERQVD